MDISPALVESGDLVLVARPGTPGAPIIGFVLRPLTPEEITEQASDPGTCLGGLLLSATAAYTFGPDEVWLLAAVIKSHKVAEDDLSPYFG